MATNLSNKGYKINDPSFHSYASNLNAARNSSVTGITSRDQIINPYEILNIAAYKNTARGQARYNEDLNELLAIQAQQQAAYDEWYNSEQSQVDRQREAGLNPDLLGVESGVSAETQNPVSSPLDGVPTNGEIAIGAVSSVASLVSTIGSIAALPASIGSAMASAGAAIASKDFTESQTRLSDMAGLSQASGNWFQAISDRVAYARQSALDSGADFDAASFLSDEKNLSGIFESYLPSGLSPDDILYGRYRSNYDMQLKAIRRIEAESAKINTDADSSQVDWIRVKSNPLVSSSDRLSLATFLPVGKAYFDLEQAMLSYQLKSAETKKKYMDNIDVLSAADAFNQANAANIAESSYNQEYYDAMNGENMANYTQFIKKSEAILARTRGMINKHYRDIWTDSSKSWTERQAALFMIIDGVSRKAADFVGSSLLNNNNVFGRIGEERFVPHGDSTPSDKMFYVGDRMLDL